MKQWDPKTILEPEKKEPRDKSLLGLEGDNQKRANESFVHSLRNETVSDDLKRGRRNASTSSILSISMMYEDTPTDCRVKQTDSVERVLKLDHDKKLS